MVYNDLGSLQNDINKAMYKACHEAALEFHAILFDYIMQDIYNHYKPNFYERTGEFLTKWLVEMSGSNTNSPLATIGLDTDTMTWNSEKFQHGNEYESAVNAIAEILFENKSGDAFGAGVWQARENAWDDTMKEYDKMFREVVVKALKKQGIDVKA